MFIVEKGMDGFVVGPKENKLGIRGLIHSIMFTDVKFLKIIEQEKMDLDLNLNENTIWRQNRYWLKPGIISGI